MKFQDYLIESWKDYKLSNSPKVLLYDFYLLSYLSSLILDPGTRKDVGLTGVGYSGKFFGREGKELDEDIQNAQRKLLPFLGTKLSQALFIAVASELRHVLDRNQQWSKFKHTDNKTFKKYIRTLRLMTDNELKDFHPTRNLERPELEVESKGRKISYQAAKKAIKETGGNVVDFARMAGDAFNDLNWSRAFGGPPWANIAKGYIDLRQALNNYNPEAPSPSSESAEKLIAAIDHAFDLEHNTGTVLNKVNYFDVGGYNWIKKALDDKRDADMYSIASKASSDMRKLGHEVLKVAGIQDKQLKKVPAEAGIPPKKNKKIVGSDKPEVTITPSELKLGDTVKLKNNDMEGTVESINEVDVDGDPIVQIKVTKAIHPDLVGIKTWYLADDLEKISPSNVVKLQGFGGKKPAKIINPLLLAKPIENPFMLPIGSILINIHSSHLYIVQMVNGPENYIKIKFIASNDATETPNNSKPEFYNGGTIADDFELIENEEKERALASYEFLDLSTPSRKASKTAKADEPAKAAQNSSDLKVGDTVKFTYKQVYGKILRIAKHDNSTFYEVEITKSTDPQVKVGQKITTVAGGVEKVGSTQFNVGDKVKFNTIHAKGEGIIESIKNNYDPNHSYAEVKVTKAEIGCKRGDIVMVLFAFLQKIDKPIKLQGFAAAYADEPAPREDENGLYGNREQRYLEVGGYYLLSNEKILVKITEMSKKYITYKIIAAVKQFQNLEGKTNDVPKDEFSNEITFKIPPEDVDHYKREFKKKR